MWCGECSIFITLSKLRPVMIAGYAPKRPCLSNDPFDFSCVTLTSGGYCNSHMTCFSPPLISFLCSHLNGYRSMSRYYYFSPISTRPSDRPASWILLPSFQKKKRWKDVIGEDFKCVSCISYWVTNNSFSYKMNLSSRRLYNVLVFSLTQFYFLIMSYIQ